METALSTAQANPATTPASGAFLETAADIGRSLCRDAIWHGDRCNFLTSTNDPAFTYPKPYFKALEADFYGGAAGVGFFLAALGHATNDALVRQTALGTLRNALLTAHRIAPRQRWDSLSAARAWPMPPFGRASGSTMRRHYGRGASCWSTSRA
ncbi:hypothetical protein [Hymenobacter radiodurans]|uniref:hypothetical protein n=1 Tax=Hymenobacter radiodurans TaxID=2496028 RepID=UPI0014050577|nr:hypothetical protein [Hymenobacter radiodurans]